MEEALIIDAAAPLFRSRWSDWCDVGAAAVLATVALEDDTAGAVTKLVDWLRFVREHDDQLVLAEHGSDIRLAADVGKTAVVLHFQSSRPLGYDPGLVELFHRIGVRVTQIAYNVRGPLGDGCLEPSDGGLSRLGTSVIQEMNRVGMVVDLSHAGPRTSLQAIETSSRPVICSHSNARTVCDHPRNLADELIRAVAASGGVIGVNAFPAFVKSGDTQPSVDDLLEHIEYIASLVGIEHAGLGLDFFEASTDEYARMIAIGLWSRDQYPPPPYRYPLGIAGPKDIPAIAAGLRGCGFRTQDVALVMGGNFLRVFGAVWPTTKG